MHKYSKCFNNCTRESHFIYNITAIYAYAYTMYLIPSIWLYSKKKTKMNNKAKACSFKQKPIEIQTDLNFQTKTAHQKCHTSTWYVCHFYQNLYEIQHCEFIVFIYLFIKFPYLIVRARIVWVHCNLNDWFCHKIINSENCRRKKTINCIDWTEIRNCSSNSLSNSM